MHSQIKLFNTILIALCVAHGALSLPLVLKPIAPASNAVETANEETLNKANDLANKNIPKMEYVLNNPTLPGHQEMIDAAFGTDPSLDMDHVKNTVQSLKTGTVPVKLAMAKDAQTIAFTLYDDSTNPMKPTHIEFGKKYHAKGTSDDARAATLVHEATHHLADTGDYIKNNEVLNGGDPQTSKQTGYATGIEPKKTAADLNKDTYWKKMRDGHTPSYGDPVPAVKNFHKNAESYGQFSAMCGAGVSDDAVCPKPAGKGEQSEKEGKTTETKGEKSGRQAAKSEKKGDNEKPGKKEKTDEKSKMTGKRKTTEKSGATDKSESGKSSEKGSKRAKGGST